MKTKDIVSLVFALIFLGVVGVIGYGQFGPKHIAKADTNFVEVVPVISNSVDPSGVLDKLDSKYRVRDFKLPVDVKSGLGNAAPFSK